MIYFPVNWLVFFLSIAMILSDAGSIFALVPEGFNTFVGYAWMMSFVLSVLTWLLGDQWTPFFRIHLRCGAIYIGFYMLTAWLAGTGFAGMGAHQDRSHIVLNDLLSPEILFTAEWMNYIWVALLFLVPLAMLAYLFVNNVFSLPLAVFLPVRFSQWIEAKIGYDTEENID